jgi:hypothetical protein
MPGTTVRPHRPFALVLGGGGARGFAHLGECVAAGLRNVRAERESIHALLQLPAES